MADPNAPALLAVERLSMRALLQLARARLGPAASALKTREELEAALHLASNAPAAAPPAEVPIVVRDFFVRHS